MILHICNVLGRFETNGNSGNIDKVGTLKILKLSTSCEELPTLLTSLYEGNLVSREIYILIETIEMSKNSDLRPVQKNKPIDLIEMSVDEMISLRASWNAEHIAYMNGLSRRLKSIEQARGNPSNDLGGRDSTDRTYTGNSTSMDSGPRSD